MLKIKVESGDDQRQIVAGLGHDALDRGLVGKDFLVLTNLQPRKMRGQQSEGMIIAADVDGQAEPVRPPESQSQRVVE